ncbi:hypothetical protein BD779DRAFT_1788859 [Infundibulicybe gibba]|nr:hypothetical protein BD779DRAFT_1788859 [Infundibulicybe gibba]
MYSRGRPESDNFIHKQLKCALDDLAPGSKVDDVIHECPRSEEITSPKNKRFILHDSQEFAPGEVENYNTVKNFIFQRANMPDLSERLHAIWLWLEIPATNNELLGRGDLDFLNLPLGKVPVVVALTKLDILVRRFEDELYDEDTYDEATFDALVWSHVEPELNRTCLVPLREATRHLSAPPSSVAVSTQLSSGPSGNTLKRLLDATQNHVHSSVSMIWALAQRVDVDMKIEASIQIGRRKYWRGLASSLFFTGKTLKSCLDLLHRDIIAIWDFYDDNKYLQSDEFKAMIVDFVSDPRAPTLKPRGHYRTSESGLFLSGVVPGYTPPVSQISATAGVKFAKWVPHVVRRLMGYIVDLIIVMQSLFWVVKKRGEEMRRDEKWGREEREQGHGYGLSVGCKLVKEAAAMYCKSGDLVRVHESITTFTNTMPLRIGHKDGVLEEIERIIRKNRFLPPASEW